MQEEKDNLGKDFPVNGETEEAVEVAEEPSAPSSGEQNAGVPKKRDGKKKKIIIALVCAALAVVATVATVLGVLLRGKAGDESPVFFTIEFLGLEQEAMVTGEAGAAYAPPETKRDGYEFDGWYADAEYTEQVDLPEVIPAENTRFYARYAKLYTVSFWDGATLLVSYTGRAGTAISVPETEKEGYECEGWFLDAQCTQGAQAPLGIPEGGGNYYIKYAELFTVLFMDGESELYRFVGKYGTPIEIDQPNKDGYDFEGWSDGTQAVQVPAQTEGNAVFYAQFSKLYTVVFWDEETEISRVTGKAGETVQIPQPQKDGFAFHGWCGADGAAVTPSAVIEADANYYTVFAKLYSVEFFIEGERVLSFQTEAGEEIAAPTAPSKAGHTFVGWFEEADAEQKVLSFPCIAVAKDIVYIAFYGENPTLTLYANAPLGTQASGETQVFEGEYGKENSVTAASIFAVTGYEFAGWAESSDGLVMHEDGDEISFSTHEELFAQWARAYTNGSEAAVIYYTELADGYPVYAIAGNRISGEISTNPLGDTEYRFPVEGGEVNGRLNADGTYEHRSAESGWYALTDGKAYLGGYGEAAFEYGTQSERGVYRIEMANLLYYEGKAFTGTYRFDNTAWEMNFVDNHAAYGNYYGERMSALILGAQAELGSAKGVYVAVGENIYFYFNGIETKGNINNGRVEYNGNIYERLDGELTLYGEAGETLSFTPNGSAYESAAQWRANGETLDGTVVGGEKLIFRGGNENYIFEWELEVLLSERSVRVTQRRERIRYMNADEFAEYQAGERDAYAVLWRITDENGDVIEGTAFTTAEGAPFFVTLEPDTASNEYGGELNGIAYTYKCVFGDGNFRCDWYGLRESAFESGAFRYEVVEYAGGKGYAAYSGYAVRERISVRFTENGEEISPEFLFLRGETEVSLITDGAHTGRYELTFARNEWGYLSGMAAVKYRNLSVGNALLAMDGEREVSFLFLDAVWREAEISRREEHGYLLLIAENRIFLREGEILNECEYRLFENIKTLIIGARVLYAEVETESGVHDAQELGGAWFVEEEFYTLRITFTGSGEEMQAATEIIYKLFCAAGDLLRERVEVWYTMPSQGVLGEIARVTIGGRVQEIAGTVDTERGLCIQVVDGNGESSDWLFTAGEPEITFVARQEITLESVVGFTILYTDDWYTVLPQARFYLGGGVEDCEGAFTHTGNDWIWRSAGTAFEELEIALHISRGAVVEDPFTVQAEGLPQTIAQGDAQAVVYTTGGKLRLGGFTVAGLAYSNPTEPLENVYYFSQAGYLVFAEEECIEPVTELFVTDGNFIFTYAQTSDSDIIPLALSRGGSPLAGRFTAGDVFVFRGVEEYSLVISGGALQVFEGTPKLYTLTFLDELEETVVYTPAGEFVLPTLPLKDGYKFVGWHVRGHGNETYTGSYTVSANTRFEAVWEPCITVNIYLFPEDAASGKVYATLEVKQKDGLDWVYIEEDLSALGLMPQKEGFTAAWYVFYIEDYNPEKGDDGCGMFFDGEWYDGILDIVLIWE